MNIHIFTLVFSLLFGMPSDSSDIQGMTKADTTEKVSKSVSKTSTKTDPEHQGGEEEVESDD